MQDILSEEEGEHYVGGRSHVKTGGGKSRPLPPSSLAIMPGEDDDVEQSWTGGLAQGCAPVFQPFGEPALSSVSLTTPSPGKTNKLENIKNWTISTYKCSRQSLYEKLGKTSRTVDPELDDQIETLRATQKKYSNILQLARALSSHFHNMVVTQNSLGECFSDLAHKSPELQQEFLYNAEAQRNLTKNGQQLLASLNFFVSSVNTIVNKTMEDSLLTVKQYEVARVEYDAYRTDLEFYAAAKETDTNQQKMTETQLCFDKKKDEFEKLRSDVQIKLKFLDENRVKVMAKQLLMFHSAVSAYFSGNQAALEENMDKFKMKSPPASWVEQ